MVEKGWSHETLDAMSEEDFGYWYGELAGLEKARAEAIRQAGSPKNT